MLQRAERGAPRGGVCHGRRVGTIRTTLHRVRLDHLLLWRNSPRCAFVSAGMTSPTSFPPAVARTQHPTVAPDLVPDRRGAVAVLSHLRRDGDWILPRLF